MKLVRYLSREATVKVGILDTDEIIPLELEGRQYRSLADLLEDDDISGSAQFLVDRKAKSLPLESTSLLPPIDRQEVWAAGVTYRRSQVARMQESESSASCYDKVYEADRPELFLKATPNRVVGHRQKIRIRQDGKWNVPEPELALVLNSSLRLVGFTIGNDMSSRDIEGENPLYLPQAKVYDECCGLGPCITLFESMPSAEETEIGMRILRDDQEAFVGTTSVANMARGFDGLIEYLGRDNSFPEGAFLLTGTGIVPPDDFTLAPHDVVEISITGIGMLSNTVVQG